MPLVRISYVKLLVWIGPKPCWSANAEFLIINVYSIVWMLRPSSLEWLYVPRLESGFRFRLAVLWETNCFKLLIKMPGLWGIRDIIKSSSKYILLNVICLLWRQRLWDITYYFKYHACIILVSFLWTKSYHNTIVINREIVPQKTNHKRKKSKKFHCYFKTCYAQLHIAFRNCLFHFTEFTSLRNLFLDISKRTSIIWILLDQLLNFDRYNVHIQFLDDVQDKQCGGFGEICKKDSLPL